MRMRIVLCGLVLGALALGPVGCGNGDAPQQITPTIKDKVDPKIQPAVMPGQPSQSGNKPKIE